MDKENIEKLLIEDIENKINNKIEFNSTVDVIYLTSRINEDDIIEKLKNYGEQNTNQFEREHYEILLPYGPDKMISEIRAKAKFLIPTLVISIERKIPKHRSMIDSFQEEYRTQIIKNDTENDIIIIRFESYQLGVSLNQYYIQNKKIFFKKELMSDGKKFLPLIN